LSRDVSFFRFLGKKICAFNLKHLEFLMNFCVF
jgi:hypothetical protein